MEQKIRIDDLINEGEGYLVEFKEKPVKLEKEICAFANAGGGTIYIGIGDDGRVKPVKLSNRLRSQLVNIGRNLDPQPEIEIDSLEDIVVLRVFESTNKPVRAPDGFYLRIGSTSQKLNRNEILSFAVTETKILFDSQLFVEKTADECLSVRQIELFRHKARLDVKLDNKQLLQNLGCLKIQNHIPYLTNAGVLLFGHEPQRYFPQAAITMLCMEDPATIHEQKIYRGTLFEQVESAFSFLSTHLHSKPKIEGLRREDLLEFPEFVLRELLVNAVIHRDYFERSADVVVKIFPAHLEFSNPGIVSNRLPLDSLFGRSFRRNPMIADIFFHANYIERAGTGLLRVKLALERLKLPNIRISEEGLFFIVELPRRDIAASGANLNNRQRELLTMSADFFPFSTAEYAERFGVSERTARLDIQNMVQNDLIVSVKEKRHVRYIKK